MGCNCVSPMGAAASYWETYSPGALYSLLVDKWEIKIPLPRSAAVTAFGKWVYYFLRGTFPNNPAGREKASAQISADMFKESGIKYSPASIYSTLQNANAYLIKELALPSKERGLMTVTEWAARKIRRGAAESLERTKETGAAIKQAFTLPKWVIWTIGGTAALVAGGAVLNYIPKRRG